MKSGPSKKMLRWRELLWPVGASFLTATVGYLMALVIASQLDTARGTVRLAWLGGWPMLVGSGIAVLALCALRWTPDSRTWRLVRWLMLPVVGVVTSVFTYAVVVAAVPLDMTMDLPAFFVFALLGTSLPGIVSPRFGRSISVLAGCMILVLGWPLAPRFTDSGMVRTNLPRYALLTGIGAGVTATLFMVRLRE